MKELWFLMIHYISERKKTQITWSTSDDFDEIFMIGIKKNIFGNPLQLATAKYLKKNQQQQPQNTCATTWPTMY